MTSTFYAPWMLDRTAAWWVKTDRAQEHINSVARQVEAYRKTEPYTLRPERTDISERFAYRLSINKPVPLPLIATIGDAVHNMRASLEALAFELARRSHNGILTPEQERRSAFPICATPKEFNNFIAGRTGLFEPRAESALRAVQPFAIMEEAQGLGVDVQRSYAENAKYDSLYALNTVWNIDKHRRLTVLAWWPGITYWMHSGQPSRQILAGDGRVEDGSILFQMQGIDPEYGTEVTQEFSLTLKDDPAFSGGNNQHITKTLENWHFSVLNWAFARVFTIMR